MRRVIFVTLAVTLALCVLAPLSPLQADGETPLGTQMQLLKHHLRAVKKALATGAAPAEADVVAMQAAALAAKQEIPAKAAGLQGDERQAFLLAYRGGMCELLKHLLDLEMAIAGGDDESRDTLIDAIELHMERSHREFRPRR